MDTSSAHLIWQALLDNLEPFHLDMEMTIAAIAAIIAFQQFAANRTHNELSVQPFLTTPVRYHLHPEDEHFYRLVLRLKNQGHGTALITNYTVYFEDQKLGSAKDSKALSRAIGAKIQEHGNAFYVENFVATRNSAIRAGEETVLISFSVPHDNKDGFDEDLKYLEKFRVEIEYKSLYDKKYSHSTKH